MSAPSSTDRQAGGRSRAGTAGQRRAAPRLGWDAAAYATCGVLAFVVAVTTAGQSFRWWATIATVGYLGGALAALLLSRIRTVRDSRTILLGAVAVAVTVVPLCVQIAAGVGVSEVEIIRAAGARLLEHGTPYPSAAELADARGPLGYQAYNVYLPVLALFGIPSGLFGDGPLTDPRLYFVLFSLAALVVAGRLWKPVLLIACVAPVSLSVASGSNDLPVIAALCAGLALASRGHVVKAGLAAGLACGMKVHAWPAVPVYLAYVAAKHGWRQAARFLAGFGITVLVGVVLPALMDVQAFVTNVIRMPLGLEPVQLLANSPLPGHLLASTGSIGRWLAVGLLGLFALGFGIWLLVRPPKDIVSAAFRLAGGFAVGICLAPQTRFGYLVYPFVLLLWLTPESWRRIRKRLSLLGRVRTRTA